ncbi:hypothetical protein DACRYDRAFT_118980 [Dacryopinax primogenitus]|uniref:Uncharacterized protein n=1 Tax=Dacryopinax primogenitus (strain DJM 731) TaxID=1858805 RepID=M5FSR0_DACPD|nr:uncharacterized protein DACRYDRAFT_118980 [Dacryopinax primogenitus]EJT98274.1 hypothetical protein DACRYDRAFT_118980 [Dacryopinax primogenitus]
MGHDDLLPCPVKRTQRYLPLERRMSKLIGFNPILLRRRSSSGRLIRLSKGEVHFQLQPPLDLDEPPLPTRMALGGGVSGSKYSEEEVLSEIANRLRTHTLSGWSTYYRRHHKELIPILEGRYGRLPDSFYIADVSSSTKIQRPTIPKRRRTDLPVPCDDTPVQYRAGGVALAHEEADYGPNHVAWRPHDDPQVADQGRCPKKSLPVNHFSMHTAFALIIDFAL